jgi:hypothetical protein
MNDVALDRETIVGVLVFDACSPINIKQALDPLGNCSFGIKLNPEARPSRKKTMVFSAALLTITSWGSPPVPRSTTRRNLLEKREFRRFDE